MQPIHTLSPAFRRLVVILPAELKDRVRATATANQESLRAVVERALAAAFPAPSGKQRRKM